jgi:hypothetical protein
LPARSLPSIDILKSSFKMACGFAIVLFISFTP